MKHGHKAHGLAVMLSICGLCSMAQVPFSLDTTFRTSIQARGVGSMALMADGGILLSGQIKFPEDDVFQAYRGSAKVWPNGERDLTFPMFPNTAGGGLITPWNDKFYVGVGQTIRRLLSTGWVDTSFIQMNSGPYFLSFQGGDYHVFPDGRLLVSGAHELDDPVRGYDGLYSLVWFSNQGYLDTTRIHRETNGVIFEIEELHDGKFLCSGTMSTYQGQPVTNIFRVHPDGTLDTTFNCSIDHGVAGSFTELPDERILVSGLFKMSTAATDTIQFVRLMPDGAIDPTFNNDLVVWNADVERWLAPKHLQLPNGHIVLMHNFDLVDGEPRRGIALLDADGNLLDDAFAGGGCGTFFDELPGWNTHGVLQMVPTSDGDWYICGQYAGYDDGVTNDPTQHFVSRLFGDVHTGAADRTSTVRAMLYPNPAATSVTLDFDLAAPLRGAELVLQDAMGRMVLRHPLRAVQGQEVMELGECTPGIYVLELRNASHTVQREKLIVQR